MSVFVVNEPYDSIVRILHRLQMQALKRDLTGIYDAANEIMELTTNKPNKELEDENLEV